MCSGAYRIEDVVAKEYRRKVREIGAAMQERNSKDSQIGCLKINVVEGMLVSFGWNINSR